MQIKCSITTFRDRSEMVKFLFEIFAFKYSLKHPMKSRYLGILLVCRSLCRRLILKLDSLQMFDTHARFPNISRTVVNFAKSVLLHCKIGSYMQNFSVLGVTVSEKQR
uniref:Uncharacterized protein n=1 Tax=Cacopsylla melanoneura TaxID=428564 RepID=A0A8D8U2W2_9HEMI